MSGPRARFYEDAKHNTEQTRTYNDAMSEIAAFVKTVGRDRYVDGYAEAMRDLRGEYGRCWVPAQEGSLHDVIEHFAAERGIDL